MQETSLTAPARLTNGMAQAPAMTAPLPYVLRVPRLAHVQLAPTTQGTRQTARVSLASGTTLECARPALLPSAQFVTPQAPAQLVTTTLGCLPLAAVQPRSGTAPAPASIVVQSVSTALPAPVLVFALPVLIFLTL